MLNIQTKSDIKGNIQMKTIQLKVCMYMLTMSIDFAGIVYILMHLIAHNILMWHGIYQKTEIQIWQTLCFQITQGKQVTSLQNWM